MVLESECTNMQAEEEEDIMLSIGLWERYFHNGRHNWTIKSKYFSWPCRKDWGKDPLANPYVENMCLWYDCRCVYNTYRSEQTHGLDATIVHRGEKEKLEHDNRKPDL